MRNCNADLPIIAIDIGGTIEDSWGGKQVWFKNKGFDIGLWPKSRSEVVKQIGGQESLYEKMVMEVYGDEAILCHKPIEGCLDALKSIAPYFRIVALSSRDEQKRDITIKWMKKQDIFNLVYRLVFLGRDGNKLEWCVNNGVQFFIDDDIRHLESPKVGDTITRIHFCQGSTENSRVSQNILSASSWQEAVKFISELALT